MKYLSLNLGYTVFWGIEAFWFIIQCLEDSQLAVA